MLPRVSRNDQRDMPRAQRKTSSTTRHGNRVALAGHAIATREEKSGRFISQKEFYSQHVKIYVGSRLLTRSRFLHGGVERRGLR